MIELVRQYYEAERATGLLGACLALGLAAIGALLWLQSSGTATVGRGMGYGLVVFGVLFALSSGGYAVSVGRRAGETSARLEHQPEGEIAKAEVARVETVLRGSYRGPLVVFTVLLLAGLGLALLSNHAPTRKGVGLALMIAGVFGHCVEGYSMEKNQRYLQRIAPRVEPPNPMS